MPLKTGFVASQAMRHARNLWLANGLMALLAAILFLANLASIIEFVTGPHPLDEAALARARDAERVRQHYVRFEPSGPPLGEEQEAAGKRRRTGYLPYELAQGGKILLVKTRDEKEPPFYSGTLAPLPPELERALPPDALSAAAPVYLDATNAGREGPWVWIIALVAAFGLGTINLFRFRGRLADPESAPLLRAWRLRGELERNAEELDAEAESPTHLFRDGWKMTPRWVYKSSAFRLQAIRLSEIKHVEVKRASRGRIRSLLAGLPSRSRCTTATTRSRRSP